MRGAAEGKNGVYAWGSSLYLWPPSGGVAKQVARSLRGGFGEGGCIDGDAIVLQDGMPLGDLVRISAGGRRLVLDHDVEMHDCAAATLLGKRGILVVHRYAQVRFYSQGGVQELYSFYTASKQGGLLLADVNGDGRTDILCGNYWILSPGAFDLPWRLFAINTRHETPDSATFRLAWLGRDLIAAQAHMADGAVFQYSPPADATQQWPETLVTTLRSPHAMVPTPRGVVIGENAGPGSRVVVVEPGGTVRDLGTTSGAHTALLVRGRVALVGAGRISWIDLASRPR